MNCSPWTSTNRKCKECPSHRRSWRMTQTIPLWRNASRNFQPNYSNPPKCTLTSTSFGSLARLITSWCQTARLRGGPLDLRCTEIPKSWFKSVPNFSKIPEVKFHFLCKWYKLAMQKKSQCKNIEKDSFCNCSNFAVGLRCATENPMSVENTQT